MARPVLITGAHRSGTTWVGRMIGASPYMRYLGETFHPGRYPCWCGVPFEYWFQYVPPECDESFLTHFRHVIRPPFPWRPAGPSGGQRMYQRIRGQVRQVYDRVANIRPLLKDPLAVFSAPWLFYKFDMDVVVMVRHPAAFASSLMQRDWQFDFKNLLGQPSLMRDHLQPFEHEIREFAARSPGVLRQAALLWRIIYSVVLDYRRDQPTWLFVRHEDLSRDPLAGFEAIYRHLRIRLGNSQRRKILAASDDDNPLESPADDALSITRKSRLLPSVWKTRLDAGQIATVRAGVEDVASHFYLDSEW